MIRTDDLQYKGLILKQDTDLACFTGDSVLLANFLRAKPSDRVIDLGCGNGVLSVLGQGKTGAHFTGIDFRKEQIELAAGSAAENGQDIVFLAMDLKDAAGKFGTGSFDVAVCNPPYFRTGDRSENQVRASARHLEEGVGLFLETAFQLLNNGGNLFLCYPAGDLADIVCALRDHRLEVKELQLITSKDGAAPYLALIRSKKNARSGMVMHPVMTGDEWMRRHAVN